MEKDLKLSYKFWKKVVISLLVIIILTCLLSSYAISALTNNFDGNCIAGAILAFEQHPSNKPNESSQINGKASKWGLANTCLCYQNYPVIEMSVSLFWIFLIFISRQRREQSTFMIIHKGWRLMVPAGICFVACTTICCVYTGLLNDHLDHFCDEFKKFTKQPSSCQLHLNRFTMDDDTMFSSATNFYLAKCIAFLRLFLWLLVDNATLLPCILDIGFIGTEKVTKKNLRLHENHPSYHLSM